MVAALPKVFKSTARFCLTYAILWSMQDLFKLLIKQKVASFNPELDGGQFSLSIERRLFFPEFAPERSKRLSLHFSVS